MQRRHQKVLEEAPAPGMPPERRAAMGEAAVAAARAVGYVGAGTVEFIADQDGCVLLHGDEHPPAGRASGDRDDHRASTWSNGSCASPPASRCRSSSTNWRINGHAIEARIYAENPEKGFLPSIGTLRFMDMPPHVRSNWAAAHGMPAGVRIDSGVREGDAISPFYDPMIAKLIVWGADRAQALARMAQALSEFHIVGLATNIAFLKRLVEGQAFSSADLDTGLIERNNDSLFPPAGPAGRRRAGAAPPSRWRTPSGACRLSQPIRPIPGPARHGWRMNGAYRRQLSFSDDYAATLDAKAYGVDLTYHAARLGAGAGRRARTRWCWRGKRDGDAMRSAWTAGRCTAPCAATASSSTCSPAACITALHYERSDGACRRNRSGGRPPDRADAGQGGRRDREQMARTVKKGEPLVIMEAMKMEHTIAAPSDGLVEEILYQVGDQVADGAPLLAFKAAA